jgi:toxin ParE1/3/4
VSLPVAFRPEARAELIDAWAWYEEQRPGLGEELEACVEAAIGAAARSPARHQRVYAEVRRVLVKRFPFGVYYIVEDGVLLVLAVAHVRRKPHYWADRVR